MTDSALVHHLGESIRKAITGEHLPYTVPFGFVGSYGPFAGIGVCTCKPDRIVNTCTKRILDAAFNLYADNHPEMFPVF